MSASAIARRPLTLAQLIEALAGIAGEEWIDPETVVVAADRTQLLIREDDHPRAGTVRAIELRPYKK